MATATAENEGTVVTETKPEATVIGKKKVVEKTGNLIMDIAHEVESLTKTKALNEADRLAENIETNYFKLGGVLRLINDNSWFEGFDSFDAFVVEKYGFAGRKARYLIEIYDNLVTKQIPWGKVSHLGWTKLKDLARILTPENVDEWVAKAEKCTVIELQAMLKAGQPGEEGEKTAKTTDDIVKMTFKLKQDQYMGNFLFHLTDRESKLRPFGFFGLGASDLSPDRSGVSGVTRFAFALGAGAKYNVSKHLGFRGQAKWSPTYLTTTDAGYWCDPFWGGCWVVGNNHYLHEFDFTGGITLRF